MWETAGGGGGFLFDSKRQRNNAIPLHTYQPQLLKEGRHWTYSSTKVGGHQWDYLRFPGYVGRRGDHVDLWASHPRRRFGGLPASFWMGLQEAQRASDIKPEGKQQQEVGSISRNSSTASLPPPHLQQYHHHQQSLNDEEFGMYRRYLKGLYHLPPPPLASTSSSSFPPLVRAYKRGPSPSPPPMLDEEADIMSRRHHHPPAFPHPLPYRQQQDNNHRHLSCPIPPPPLPLSHHRGERGHPFPPPPPPSHYGEGEEDDESSRRKKLAAGGVAAMASVYKLISNHRHRKRGRQAAAEGGGALVLQQIGEGGATSTAASVVDGHFGRSPLPAVLIGIDSWKKRVAQAPRWSQLRRYQFLNSLGKGAHAETFLVKRNGKNYVLKESELLAETINEARLLSQVSSPHVIRVEDFFIELLGHRHVAYLQLEYCDGGDLSALILDSSPSILSDRFIRDILVQIAKGLVSLHSQHIIHRDLKPENILLTREGCVKIADMGVSTRLTESLSTTHQAAGSIPFMAPEMRRVLLGAGGGRGGGGREGSGVDAMIGGEKGERAGALPGVTSCDDAHVTFASTASLSYDEKVDIWALGSVAYAICMRTLAPNLANVPPLNVVAEVARQRLWKGGGMRKVVGSSTGSSDSSMRTLAPNLANVPPLNVVTEGARQRLWRGGGMREVVGSSSSSTRWSRYKGQKGGRQMVGSLSSGNMYEGEKGGREMVGSLSSSRYEGEKGGREVIAEQIMKLLLHTLQVDPRNRPTAEEVGLMLMEEEEGVGRGGGSRIAGTVMMSRL